MELMPFITDLTPAGIVLLGVAMMMVGWLLPIRVVRILLASKQAVIDEQARHLETKDRALQAALRGNAATEAVLDAIPAATTEIQRRSGADDGASTG